MSCIIAVDAEKCMACKSCELECAVAHSVARELLAAAVESPAPRARVTVMGVAGMAIPLQCRHCEDAPCVAICPSQALQKPETSSPVITRAELCIGCKSCVLVCPFGVISMGADGKSVIKCDLCIERLEEGQQPACVVACPTHALSLQEVEAVAIHHRRAAAAEMVAALDRTRRSLRAALHGLIIEEDQAGGRT